MPRKYIHIKQLNARTPFTHSQLHFMVRLKQKQVSPVEMEMENKVVSVSLNEYVQFQYNNENSDDLGMYVIAIGGCDRVVCIGHIGVDLGEEVNEKKQYLKGVAKQNGYLIYSSRDGPFPEQIRLQSVSENKQKIKAKSQILTKNTVLPSDTKGMKVDKQEQRSEHVFKRQSANHNQLSSQNISPVRSQLRKGYDSLIDVFNTENKLQSSQNIKSEGHFQTNNKNKHSPYSYLDSSGTKYKKAKQKLLVHKQKNTNYNSELIELQRQFIRQQQKIRELGIINKQ